MKLSTRARYGLRALIDLGIHSEDENVSIQSISKRLDISSGYLEQIMALLRKADLITSTRGAQGGYKLSKPPQEISIGEVLRVLEGNLEAVDCPGIDSESSCEVAGTCIAKYVWKRLNDSIRETMDTMMLSELINENKVEAKASKEAN